jgi:carbonic anhydrase
MKKNCIIFVFVSIFCICNGFELFKRGTDSDTDKSHDNHGPAKHWGYRNQDKSVLPREWYKSHPKCYGTQQSPINLETASSQYDDDLDTIKITGKFLNETEKAVNEEWTISNNGHSGKFCLFWSRLSFNIVITISYI